MPITFTPPTLTNTSQIGGNQTNTRTIALDNGGYVVAWQGSFGGGVNCYFQRGMSAMNLIVEFVPIARRDSMEAFIPSDRD